MQNVVSDAVNQMVIKMVKMMNLRKLKITALNFFEIGNDYFYKFSGLMLSYIIILIQLN